jgi:hypothetical protein
VPSDSNSSGDADSRAGKVIELREHHAAERLLDELLACDPSSSRFSALVSRCSLIGIPLLAAITRRLDGFRPRTVDTLSRVVAAYPEPEEAARVLRRIAHDRRNTDRRRMGAVMVLEQAFGHRPPDDFLSTLQEPVRSATGLLLGALEGSEGNSAALHEYLRALIFQPLDLLYSVLAMLAQSRDDRTVDVLHLLALQPDPDLQLGAIDALSDTGTKKAIRALQVLELTLSDEAARAVGRSLQKLRLSGITTTPLSAPDVHCRAWLSAVDGSGERLMWLAVPTLEHERDITLLGLLLSDQSGVVDALGTATANPSMLPMPAFVGRLHPRLAFRIGSQPADSSLGVPTGAYLEVPFDYALGLLHELVRLNWSSGTSLPVEYQLLSPFILEYGAPLQDNQRVPAPSLEPLTRSVVENESDLLFNPLFDTWYVESPGVRTVAADLAAVDDSISRELADESWKMLLPALIRLAQDEFGPALRARFSQRLRRMAEWLAMAGNYDEAAMAAQAAQTMLNSPPVANLFVLRLLQKGILVALSDPNA